MSVHLKSRIPEIIATSTAKVARANRQTAERVVAEAKDRVQRRQDTLYDEIHYVLDGDDYLIHAGRDDAFYGHMVEYGTAHSAPFPFLMPAAEAARDSHLDGIAEAYQ
jgi:hypothetical protein